MIQAQFAYSGLIDIPLILTSNGYSTRYIQDHQDKYSYVLHTITEKKVFNKAIGPDGFVPLHLQTLRSFLGARYADEIVANLLQWGILRCDGWYDVGKKSRGYAICPMYTGKAVLRDIYKEEIWLHKLRKQADQYQKNQGDAITRKHLSRVGIHRDEAELYIERKLANTLNFLAEWEEQLSSITSAALLSSSFYASFLDALHAHGGCYSLMMLHMAKKCLHVKGNERVGLYELLKMSVVNMYNADLVAITKIANRDYFLRQPDNASRIYTNVSNQSTDLRQFWHHRTSKSRLVNLDIRNSQPYLLSLLLVERYAGETMPADVQRYIDLCANGELYEYLMIWLKVPQGRRREFKVAFFASLFFCDNRHAGSTTAGKFFRTHFPNVYALIHAFKKDDFKQLAITMQRREARIILNVIGKALRKQNIWYATIHDSVVVLEEHATSVKSIVLTAFREAVGVAPTIEEEVLQKGHNSTERGQWDKVEDFLSDAENLGAAMMQDLGNEMPDVGQKENMPAVSMAMVHADLLRKLHREAEERKATQARLAKQVENNPENLIYSTPEAVNLPINVETEDGKGSNIIGPFREEDITEPNVDTWDAFETWAASVWGPNWSTSYKRWKSRQYEMLW